jgi:hypothetical protein
VAWLSLCNVFGVCTRSTLEDGIGLVSTLFEMEM